MALLWTILIFALIGLIAGALARLVVPGRQSMGIGMTIVLGIIGSFAGGFLSWLFTGGGGGPLQASGLLMSIVGAIIVLGAYVAFSGRKRAV